MAPRSSSNNKKGRHCPLFLAVVLLLSSSVAHGYRVRPPVTMTASKTKKPQAQTLASSQAAPVGMPPPLLDTKMVPGSSHSAGSKTTVASDSPFHCLLEDELGRPRSETRPKGDGRSWHASLQLGSALQILSDASRLRSVSRDMLQDALHCIEYESLFSSSKATAATTTNEQLDGTWRLAFNSGGAFPLKGARQDRWGYLKDDVEVRIDNGGASVLVDAFAKRFEGTLHPLPNERKNTLALDFSRVQLLKPSRSSSSSSNSLRPMLSDGELKVVNAILRPGAKLHLIAVAASYLALRFTPAAVTGGGKEGGGKEAEAGEEGSSSLLVFARTDGHGSSSMSMQQPAVEAVSAATATAKTTEPSSSSKAAAAIPTPPPQAPPAPVPKFKKPLKGTLANPYASVWEYLEEESMSLYLVLAFPTFAKHLPAILHSGRFKWLLLQELWHEAARHMHMPFHP